MPPRHPQRLGVVWLHPSRISQKPIQAGKKDRIKVTYNPAGRPGEFTKNVTVRSNDKRHKRVTLKIKGFVNPAKNDAEVVTTRLI